VRILYCALDQRVPGTLGGSVHVQAVAEGLAALGHEVHTITGSGDGPRPQGPVHWHTMRPPAGRSQLRLLRSRAVRRLARTIRPDVVIERYHNFGGEGALAAKATGARFALEVNAPVIDYPGSPKAALDRALIAQPMRRWRDWQVSQADLIVTPSAKILPDGVPADRVLEIEWGADTRRFHPGATGAVPWARDPSSILAVFAGAFRAWHGAIQLVEAIKRLHALGHTTYQAVLIGEGPERAAAEQAARGARGITFAGRVAHRDMPSALAAADIGVAPFDVSQHPPLALAFYWSPLKVFEYMASGLPVVAPGLPRLQGLIEHGVEGALYEPATPAALAEAMATLADPAIRAQMGQAARARAVRDYGWDAHCRALDAALRARI
jgi:glycosyltransferase involved in cell wall biosynthesis